jgi:hypothetical protein
MQTAAFYQCNGLEVEMKKKLLLQNWIQGMEDEEFRFQMFEFNFICTLIK